MKNPTTNTDLLFAFTLLKGDGAVSVPNMAKVDTLAHLTLSALLNSSAGIGTMHGLGLKLAETTTLLVLGYNADGDNAHNEFEENKQRMLQQLDVLRAKIAEIGPQETKVLMEKLQGEAKQFLLEVKQKMAMTHPDVGVDIVQAVEDKASAAAKEESQQEANMELAKLLFGDKTKKQVH